MITISADTNDDNSILEIKEYTTSVLKRLTARIDRTKTLDGGVSFNHYGFSEGDRDIEIECYLTESQESILQNIFENYTSHTLTTREGYFKGAMSELTMKYGETKFKFLVQEKHTVED